MKGVQFYYYTAALSLAFLLQGMGILNLIMPPEFLTGMRVPLACITVIVIHFPLFLGRLRIKTQASKVIKLTYALAIVFTLSVLYGGVPAYGMWKLGAFFCLSIVPTFLLTRYYSQITSLFKGIFRALLLFSFVPLVQILSVIRDAGYVGLKWFLLQNGFDVIGMSRSLGLGATLYLAVFFRSQIRLHWLMALVFAMFMITGQILLQERGPLLSCAVSLIYLVVSNLKNSCSPGKIRIFLVIFIMLLFVSCIFYTNNLLFDRFSLNPYEDNRVLIILKAIEDIDKMNFLVGNGFGNFFYSGEGRQFPHNLFVEIFIETGMIGLSIFILFCFHVFLLMYNSTKYSILKNSLIVSVGNSIFIYSIVNSMVSGDIATNYMVWVSSGFLVCAILNEKESNIHCVKQRIPRLNQKFDSSIGVPVGRE